MAAAERDGVPVAVEPAGLEAGRREGGEDLFRLEEAHHVQLLAASPRAVRLAEDDDPAPQLAPLLGGLEAEGPVGSLVPGPPRLLRLAPDGGHVEEEHAARLEG